VTAALALLASVSPAEAARPTDLVGLFSFDASDVIATWDEPTGDVRVHYSISGPNVTDLTDSDADGVPDFVYMAGTFGAESLALYVETGFLHPVRESEVGLSALGGSDAFDLYLVDFDGQADGNLSVDRCADGRCAAALIVENDFTGYGYPSDEAALATVVPHELFHAVQYAYTEDLEVWTSEGTATWAERLYVPASQDFLRQVSGWFEEPTRAIDEPPVGPVPGFAYATGLWFDFLTTRHDPQVVVELLEARSTSPASDLEVMLGVLEDRGDDVRDMWETFSAWNLATGDLSGAFEGYDYARYVGPPLLEDEARVLDDDARFYPLATTYYRLEHRGGELWFGLDEAAPDVSFSLHGVDGEGRVLPAELLFDGSDPAVRLLADLPPGDYYLWGSQAVDGPESIKVRFCAGPEVDVVDCFAAEPTTPEPTGDTGTDDDGGGCGCASGPASGFPALLLLAAATLGRRRWFGWSDDDPQAPGIG
jgi:MYXO-CTERM domain-containing protein